MPFERYWVQTGELDMVPAPKCSQSSADETSGYLK